MKWFLILSFRSINSLNTSKPRFNLIFILKLTKNYLEDRVLIETQKSLLWVHSFIIYNRVLKIINPLFLVYYKFSINIVLYLIIKHLRLFNEHSIYKILYKHETLQIMIHSLIFLYSTKLQLVQLNYIYISLLYIIWNSRILKEL